MASTFSGFRKLPSPEPSAHSDRHHVSIGHVRFSRFLANFRKSYDGVEVAVTENSLGAIKEKLRDGELDVAILNPLDGLGEDLNAQELYKERYIVIFPPDHRLGDLNAIKLTDLSGEPYVDRLVWSWSSPGLMDTMRVVRGECHHAENEEPLPA